MKRKLDIIHVQKNFFSILITSKFMNSKSISEENYNTQYSDQTFIYKQNNLNLNYAEKFLTFS